MIPTSNHNWKTSRSCCYLLYIFWFLHQTTTRSIFAKYSRCCISFDSYIKPQPWCYSCWLPLVVYLLIPTSNHNQASWVRAQRALYIFWFLHQTTTLSLFTIVPIRCISFDSYIKPQLTFICCIILESCISFDSYIKPQRKGSQIPYTICCISFDSYIKPQLSVCSLLSRWSCISFDSYIKPQQVFGDSVDCLRCISFDSYIKPQPEINWMINENVVYLLIPTSNHNVLVWIDTILKLYIFWFLHQTTTHLLLYFIHTRCISFDSYIKPQLFLPLKETNSCCISFDSYIKPQR